MEPQIRTPIEEGFEQLYRTVDDGLDRLVREVRADLIEFTRELGTACDELDATVKAELRRQTRKRIFDREAHINLSYA